MKSNLKIDRYISANSPPKETMSRPNKHCAPSSMARHIGNIVKIAYLPFITLIFANSISAADDFGVDIQRLTPILTDTLMRSNEIDSTNDRCANKEANLDRCSAQLIAFGQKGVIYPGNMEQLDNVYCPNFRRIVDCIGNSTTCYKPFERQIINWVLSSTRRLNYKRCRNEKEKLKFLKLTKSCDILMKKDSCMTNYVASLEGIAELDRRSEDDIQIQLSCCANRKFQQCVLNNAKHQCKAVDNFKKLQRANSNSSQRMAHKSLQRVMASMMDDLKSTLESMSLTGPELICRTVDDNFCKTKFEGKFNHRVARHKSIVPAMIKIYSNK